ncbi:hypothetical protein [Mycoplasma nasistruthionis]|uniref:Variable surface lipoprotein n=1 Tax=Mycoplasma nasistruthionis TaxID=353852 RepID=A0A5B7XU98_9MOLU|nr:hypothetical protein [Mycoplasma nasistruthionis]QCZ36436.1 hypothetical protein FG904_00115 [Mycoplasma nasistruthionis]
MKFKKIILLGLSALSSISLFGIAASCNETKQKSGQADKESVTVNSSLKQAQVEFNDKIAKLDAYIKTNLETIPDYKNALVSKKTELVNLSQQAKENEAKLKELSKLVDTNIAKFDKLLLVKNQIESDSYSALNVDSLKPELKPEISGTKTVYSSDASDLVSPSIQLSDELVEVISNEEPIVVDLVTQAKSSSDEQTATKAQESIDAGKIKVQKKFIIRQKEFPQIKKEVTKTYEIEGYLTKQKVEEILETAVNNLTVELNNKSKLEIAESKDPRYTSKAAKVLNGNYSEESLAKAVRVLGMDDRFDVGVVAVDTDVKNGKVWLKPFVALKGEKNGFRKFKHKPNTDHGDVRRSSFVFDQLPKLDIAPAGYVELFNLRDIISVSDEKILSQLSKTSMNDVAFSEITTDILTKSLVLKSNTLKTQANDYSMELPSTFLQDIKATVTDVKLIRTKIKNSEQPGPIALIYTVSISTEKVPGNIYLGKKSAILKDLATEQKTATFSQKLDSYVPKDTDQPTTPSSRPSTGTSDNNEVAPANAEEYKQPFVFAKVTKGNKQYDGATKFDSIVKKKEAYDKKQKKAGGLIQLYKSSKNTIDGFGIASGGNDVDNIVITIKEGLDLSKILSTLDAKASSNNKYFEGAFNKEARTITIKFKTSFSGQDVHEQTFTFATAPVANEGTLKENAQPTTTPLSTPQTGGTEEKAQADQPSSSTESNSNNSQTEKESPSSDTSAPKPAVVTSESSETATSPKAAETADTSTEEAKTNSETPNSSGATGATESTPSPEKQVSDSPAETRGQVEPSTTTLPENTSPSTTDTNTSTDTRENSVATEQPQGDQPQESSSTPAEKVNSVDKFMESIDLSKVFKKLDSVTVEKIEEFIKPNSKYYKVPTDKSSLVHVARSKKDIGKLRTVATKEGKKKIDSIVFAEISEIMNGYFITVDKSVESIKNIKGGNPITNAKVEYDAESKTISLTAKVYKYDGDGLANNWKNAVELSDKEYTFTIKLA